MNNCFFDYGPEKLHAVLEGPQWNSGPIEYKANVVYECCEGGIGQDESR
jgi:hypothetical protein